MNKLLAVISGAGQINTATTSDYSEKGLLSGEKTFSLKGAKGKRVTCNAGLLWVTQEGDLEDHVLAPAESMVLTRDGKVVLAPLGSASYRVA